MTNIRLSYVPDMVYFMEVSHNLRNFNNFRPTLRLVLFNCSERCVWAVRNSLMHKRKNAKLPLHTDANELAKTFYFFATKL